MVGSLAAVSMLFALDFALGLILHIFLDFLTGETKSFSPFSNLTANFNWPMRAKLVLGGIIWGIGVSIMLM